jgi:hypothetical protein
MKNLTLFFPLFILCLIAGCKKDDKISPAVVKTETAAIPTDSSSFIINGSTYTQSTQGMVLVGNAGANMKIDTVIDKNRYYSSGDKDSVFFYRSYALSNEAATSSVVFSFFKKYNINEMVSEFTPANKLDLFGLGEHPYAVDFLRENAHNGVAIAVNGVGQTYINSPLEIPTTITPGSENNSSFEITTFKKLDDGEYLLEATFNAILFDKNENPVKLENGYVRMVLNL